MLNRRRPKMEPCGTPHVMRNHPDSMKDMKYFSSFYCKWKIFHWRHVLVHSHTQCELLCCGNFVSSCCGRVCERLCECVCACMCVVQGVAELQWPAAAGRPQLLSWQDKLPVSQQEVEFSSKSFCGCGCFCVVGSARLRSDCVFIFRWWWRCCNEVNLKSALYKINANMSDTKIQAVTQNTVDRPADCCRVAVMQQ